MIEDLLAADPLQLAIVILLAFVPAIIWFFLLFQGRKGSRKTLFFIFFLGTLTVIPFLIMDYLWYFFPQLDVYQAIDTNIQNATLAAFVGLLVVGASEEMGKSAVVRFVDKTRIGVQNINDAIKYSILAGLGFAFVENIFYFFYIWQSSGFAGLIGPMIFRSIFTVSAHMVFSGIFGYFHGISKFSKPIMETKLWMNDKAHLTKITAKILGTDEANAYRQLSLFGGLITVMLMHAFYNFFLEIGWFIPVMGIVIGGFIYLLRLRAHKAGAIAYAGMGRSSSIARKDEDVVIELLGMWTNEGRYKDVIDICQRLLMRDPDNKVVQLFQAKAMDSQKLGNVENSFYSLFSSSENKEQDKSIRTLVKQKVLMEMLKEKQGSPPSKPPQAPAPQEPAKQAPQMPSMPGPTGQEPNNPDQNSPSIH